MRGSIVSALLFVLALFPTFAFGQGATMGRTTSVVGCLRVEQDVYVLDVNDQTHYRLRGDSSQLNQYKNQTVRVTGTLSANRNPASITNALRVTGIQSAGGSCGTQAQTRRWDQNVAGKQGAPEDTEVVTSTATVGQITPGSQTEEGAKQNPDQYAALNTSPSIPPQSGPSQAAPPNFDDAGQNEQQANLDAAAALRAEVAEGRGLGLQGAMPESQTTGTMNEQSAANVGPKAGGGTTAAGTPRGGTPANAMIAITDRGLQPSQASLQSGESLILKNQTNHACNLKGPSISGTLQPGSDYRHRFTNPGTYKVSCGNSSGEILVR